VQNQLPGLLSCAVHWLLCCKQREVIASIQQMIDGDIDASRRLSLNLNASLTFIESNLAAQESTVNRTLSTLVTEVSSHRV